MPPNFKTTYINITIHPMPPVRILLGKSPDVNKKSNGKIENDSANRSDIFRDRDAMKAIIKPTIIEYINITEKPPCAYPDAKKPVLAFVSGLP